MACRSFCCTTCPQALASAFGFTFSAFVALACTTALLSLAGVWAAVGLAIAAGARHRVKAAGWYFYVRAAHAVFVRLL